MLFPVGRQRPGTGRDVAAESLPGERFLGGIRFLIQRRRNRRGSSSRLYRSAAVKQIGIDEDHSGDVGGKWGENGGGAFSGSANVVMAQIGPERLATGWTVCVEDCPDLP